MSIDNLRRMYEFADQDDRREGKLAYRRYNAVMATFAGHYGFELAPVTAAFVSLSPNSDYHGNLRSLVSVIEGLLTDKPLEEIKVSTYNHCRDRAYEFLKGAPFDTPGRGLKISAFYHNILDPGRQDYVTIDGHIVLAYEDREGVMKDAKITAVRYREIAADVRGLAFEHHLLPCEMQATIWYARKRKLGIKYDAQLDMFADPSDKWNTVLDPREVRPYT